MTAALLFVLKCSFLLWLPPRGCFLTAFLFVSLPVHRGEHFSRISKPDAVHEDAEHRGSGAHHVLLVPPSAELHGRYKGSAEQGLCEISADLCEIGCAVIKPSSASLFQAMSAQEMRGSIALFACCVEPHIQAVLPSQSLFHTWLLDGATIIALIHRILGANAFFFCLGRVITFSFSPLTSLLNEDSHFLGSSFPL